MSDSITEVYNHEFRQNLKQTLQRNLEHQDIKTLMQNLSLLANSDKDAADKTWVKEFLTNCLEATDAETTLDIITYGLLSGSQNPHYSHLGAKNILSLSCADSLDDLSKINTAYLAARYLPAHSLEWGVAIDRVYDLAKDSKNLDPNIAYTYTVQAMLKSKDDPALSKTGQKLWRALIEKADNISPHEEARAVILIMPADSPVQKEALSIWKKSVEEAFNSGMRAAGFAELRKIITNDKSPQPAVKDAINIWKTKYDQISRSKTLSSQINNIMILTATKFFVFHETDTPGRQDDHIKDFKHYLSRHLLKAALAQGDPKRRGQALIQAGRYDGDDQDLRISLVIGLQSMINRRNAYDIRAVKRAERLIENHLEYLHGKKGPGGTGPSARGPSRPPPFGPEF